MLFPCRMQYFSYRNVEFICKMFRYEEIPCLYRIRYNSSAVQPLAIISFPYSIKYATELGCSTICYIPPKDGKSAILCAGTVRRNFLLQSHMAILSHKFLRNKAVLTRRRVVPRARISFRIYACFFLSSFFWQSILYKDI